MLNRATELSSAAMTISFSTLAVVNALVFRGAGGKPG